MMQVVGLSVCGLLLAVLVRDYNKTISYFVVLATAALLLLLVINSASEIFTLLINISSGNEAAAEYIKLMIKVLGVTLISQLVCDMCRDAGEGALANQTEVATKIVVVSMVIPLFEAVLNIITGLMQ